jgi:fructosamine-3-kinase
MSNLFDLAPDAEAGFAADTDIEVDKAVVKLLPKDSKIVSAAGHGASLWTRSARIDVELPDGTPKSYFMKVATGPNGLSMLKGEYNSSVDMDTVIPGFAPIPIGWGTFESDSNLHFFLQAFHEMDNEVPDMDQLTKTLAEMHLKSADMLEDMAAGHQRPEGKVYGYHITTHNGKLAQDNTWTATWEEYFVNNMKCMLDHDEKEGGPRPQEMEDLLLPLFEKVIPRLLRPMEIDGRHVKPCLLHGDLWYANCSTDLERNRPIVYDACCFWGHNEYDIRTMRAKTRYKFGRAQQKMYLQHFPAAYPVEDFEWRNALYHLRCQLHDSSLFPQNPRFRQLFIEEARQLVEMFPGGFEEWDANRRKDGELMEMN